MHSERDYLTRIVFPLLRERLEPYRIHLREIDLRWGITEEQVRQKYVNQVPMKRGCSYDDVCNLVVFLSSDQSSYMTGQAINVTGGQEMH